MYSSDYEISDIPSLPPEKKFPSPLRKGKGHDNSYFYIISDICPAPKQIASPPLRILFVSV